MMKITDRDHARLLIAERGITTENISDTQLRSLGHYIDMAMIDYDGMFSDFKMDHSRTRFMTCQTTQWQGREAVSFNRDGFIGIAGWAGDSNVRPILDGIAKWLERDARATQGTK